MIRRNGFKKKAYEIRNYTKKAKKKKIYENTNGIIFLFVRFGMITDRTTLTDRKKKLIIALIQKERKMFSCEKEKKEIKYLFDNN